MSTPTKKRKSESKGAGLPIIECSCGAKIVLVTNVAKMSEAIEAHALEHAKAFKTKREKDAEAERVRDDLIAKVLDRACEA